MIIDKDKLIFLHIPKTGGSSIENALSKAFFNPYVFDRIYMFGLINNQYSQHFNYQNICAYSNRNLTDYFIFTFVRNTWDRLVSAYKYLYQHKDFKTHIIKMCAKLQSNKLDQTDHFNTQMVFIKDKNGIIVPDFIGRFENLQNDFDYVCDVKNLQRKKLDTINQSKNKKPYQEYYDNYTIGLVKETYRQEIDFFDFKFQ